MPQDQTPGVTLEYIMIDGVNDGDEDLEGLLTLTTGGAFSCQFDSV